MCLFLAFVVVFKLWFGCFILIVVFMFAGLFVGLDVSGRFGSFCILGFWVFVILVCFLLVVFWFLVILVDYWIGLFVCLL